MGNLMDAICLALWNNGPMTLNDLHYETGLPYTALRYHLRLHHGDRYSCTRKLVGGVPTRVWRLMEGTA